MNNGLLAKILRHKGTAVVMMICMVYALALANTTVSNRGSWPRSWPNELEPFRTRAASIGENWASIYQIPFTNREEFESAWPYVLKLKSKGAPIILESGPAQYQKMYGTTMRAGVRILHPQGAWPVQFHGRKTLMLGPPWPESIKSATGELPEYVTEQGGEWVPFTGQKEENHLAEYVSHWRARVDLVLIVDGQIVDTNRIQFPAGTTVIDKRSRK